MTDDERMALIHAELDGDLTHQQRADLARLLLADPRVRAVRDELRGLCSRLDAVGQVEPPPQFKDSILNRLPSVPIATAYRKASFGRWRLAAMVAGLLTAGTIVYETVQGPAPGNRETAGTMAAARATTTVDAVSLANGPIAGRVSLYRDASGLGLKFELATSAPVDVLVASGGYTIRIKDLGGKAATGEPGTTVALPGFKATGQAVNLTFLVAGREVANATLTAHESR